MHDLDVLLQDFAILSHLPDKGGVVRLRGRGGTGRGRVRCRGKGGPAGGGGPSSKSYPRGHLEKGGKVPEGEGQGLGPGQGPQRERRFDSPEGARGGP